MPTVATETIAPNIRRQTTGTGATFLQARRQSENLAHAFEDSDQGLADAEAWLKGSPDSTALAAHNPAALDYYPHQDDTKHGGPRGGTRTRKTTTYKVDGEHRAIWEELNAEGRLDAGIEIKTSKDGLRAVLGAALHMCFTGEQEGWPVGKLFVNRPVTARVRDFVLRRTDVIIETREDA